MNHGRFIWFCTGAKALKYVQSALNHTTIALQIAFFNAFLHACLYYVCNMHCLLSVQLFLEMNLK